MLVLFKLFSMNNPPFFFILFTLLDPLKPIFILSIPQSLNLIKTLNNILIYTSIFFRMLLLKGTFSLLFQLR
jgi:hypothetical protein